jgi:cytoskeletal protein RodZ
MVFKKNKIFLDSEMISEQLRSARQAKGLKLEEVSLELGIPLKYLDALEKRDFDLLPSGVYSKNFLREYSNFLDLDPDEMIMIFEEEVSGLKEERERSLFSRQVAKVRYFLSAPRIIRNVIIFFVVLIFFVYLGFAVKNIFSPAKLLITNPASDYIANDRLIEVIGITEAEAEVTINGEPVLIDSEGNFSEKVVLKTGINKIKITAKKKYGLESVVVRQILVNE